MGNGSKGMIRVDAAGGPAPDIHRNRLYLRLKLSSTLVRRNPLRYTSHLAFRLGLILVTIDRSGPWNVFYFSRFATNRYC